MENIERYIIIKELGGQQKRKFGKTFWAEDKDSLQKVILKIFVKSNKNIHLFEQVKKESTFHFKDSGLPNIIDSFHSEEKSVLVLAFKEGIPIDQYWLKLKRKNRILFLIAFLDKLIPIFNEMQDMGIVHCDIKPGNIIIEENETDFNVHLIDFGMAIRKDERRDLLFPLGYAAPELILNHLSIINQRTDQFSLGILIWKLYANKLPLSHFNPSIFTNLQITHPLPEHSDVPRKIYRILFKMTNKHQFALPPNKMKENEVEILLQKAMLERYSSLEEIVLDLKAIPRPFYQIISRR